MRPRLLDMLPEVLRADPAMEDFLKAFEKVLLGRSDWGAGTDENLPYQDRDLETLKGLEEILDDLPRYFTPGTSAADGAPDEFLPWLSQWLALSLRTDIFQADATTTQAEADERNKKKRRQFIARMADLYRCRGTKKSMQELLEIFTGKGVTIDDQVDGQAFYFKVLLNLEQIKAGASRGAFERAKELAHSVVRLEKPAHTRYLLIPAVTTMRIGPGIDSNGKPYFIKLGDNTRLGSIPSI